MNIYRQPTWINIATALLLLLCIDAKASGTTDKEMQNANLVSVVDQRRLKIDRNQTSFEPLTTSTNYRHVQFQPASVVLVKRWRSIQPRSLHHIARRLTKKDQQQVEESLSKVVDKQLNKQLDKLTPYKLIASEALTNNTQPYLIIKPEITQLDVNALPKRYHDGQIRTLSRDYSGTLILYVYDGKSGRLLGKIEDRERSTNMNWTRRPTSNGDTETRRLVNQWLAVLDKHLLVLLKEG